jgi:hypothetical protein
MSTATATKTVTLRVLEPYATQTDEDGFHYVAVAEEDARALFLDLRKMFEHELTSTKVNDVGSWRRR